MLVATAAVSEDHGHFQPQQATRDATEVKLEDLGHFQPPRAMLVEMAVMEAIHQEQQTMVKREEQGDRLRFRLP